MPTPAESERANESGGQRFTPISAQLVGDVVQTVDDADMTRQFGPGVRSVHDVVSSPRREFVW